MKEVVVIGILMIQALSITGIIQNIPGENTIYTRILLDDGTPLPNATLIVYYGEFRWVENRSDRNGYVYVELPGGLINKLHLVIRYNPYPDPLYELRNIDRSEVPEAIHIPYRMLRLHLQISDEYLHGVNGSYTLYYHDQVIRHGNITGGILEVNGYNDYNGYILIGVGEKSNILPRDYMINIIVNNSITYSIGLDSISDDKLIIDLYKPRVELLNFTYTINHSLGIISFTSWIEYSDGVNTGRVSIEVYYSFPRKGLRIEEVSRRASLTNCRGIDSIHRMCMAKYNDLLTVIPENYTVLPVKLIIKAIDPEDRLTEVIRQYFININKSITTPPPTRTTTSREGYIGGIEIKGSNTSTSPAKTIGGIFNPSVKTGRTSILDTIYYLGPIIGFGIVIYELYRSRRGSVSPSHGGE